MKSKMLRTRAIVWLGTTLLLWVAQGFMLRAQDRNIPLKTVMKQSDSLAIIATITRANQFQHTNPDSAIAYSEKSYLLSLRYGYDFGCGISLANMATAYRNKGANQESITLFHKALYFLNRQNRDREYYLAATYNTMFGAYFPLGMFDSAALNCYKVIMLYRNASDKNINPANSYVDPLIDAHQYLGICWQQMGYYQRSLNYIEQAEELSLKDKNQYQILSILGNKSGVYLNLGKPQEALHIARQGLLLSDKKKDSSCTQIFRVNIASALLQMNKTDASIRLLKQILAQKPGPYNDKPTHIMAAFTLGYAYYQNKQFPEALTILTTALQEADRMGLRFNTIQPHTVLSATYEALGATEKAFETLKIKEALEDTLTNRASRVMNMMDLTLQTSERDKKISLNASKIKLQQQKLQQQRTWILIIGSGLIMLLVLLVLLYRINRHKRLRQEQRLLLLNKEQEVRQLRALMQGEEQERARFARELHDGFVSQLSAIKMNFSTMDAAHFSEAKQLENILQLEETIKELRKTAHNLMPEILLNAGLCEAVHIYCDRINQSHSLFVDFRTYGYLPKLEVTFALPLYRMIQEAIQNIIKHSGADQAIIQFNFDKNILGITIEDNGRGFEAQDKQGAGLQNFRIRTQSLNGQFHFSSSPDIGTTLYFEFELNNNE